MGKKKDDNENKNYKVPPLVIKQPIVDRKKVPPIADREVIPLTAAGKPITGSIGAIVDKKKNPKVTKTEQENLINGEKPGTSAAAALAGKKQNPSLMDSLITDEKAKIDLKDAGISKLAGRVPPIVDPKPTPESNGGNSVGNNFQNQKK